MKVLSLMLLSLVSAMEYECGSINEPHFHHYRSRDFIGHFKIKNEKYQILESKADKDKRRARCLQAKTAIDSLPRKYSGMLINTYTRLMMKFALLKFWPAVIYRPFLIIYLRHCKVYVQSL